MAVGGPKADTKVDASKPAATTAPVKADEKKPDAAVKK
jgi:hypothetical protein